MTLGLAIISVIATQIYGARALGIGGYASKFFNFRGGPVMIFVGVLELIGEFARIVSFSFRLFGNIFAGKLLLGVISFLIPFVAATPFYGLEIFIGFIQAVVFAALTLVFLTIAVTGHREEHHGACRVERARVASSNRAPTLRPDRTQPTVGSTRHTRRKEG